MMLYISQLNEYGKPNESDITKRKTGYAKFVLDNLEGKMSIDQIHEKTNLPKSGIRRVMSELFYEGLIEKSGNLKNRKYKKIDCKE